MRLYVLAVLLFAALAQAKVDWEATADEKKISENGASISEEQEDGQVDGKRGGGYHKWGKMADRMGSWKKQWAEKKDDDHKWGKMAGKMGNWKKHWGDKKDDDQKDSWGWGGWNKKMGDMKEKFTKKYGSGLEKGKEMLEDLMEGDTDGAQKTFTGLKKEWGKNYGDMKKTLAEKHREMKEKWGKGMKGDKHGKHGKHGMMGMMMMKKMMGGHGWGEMDEDTKKEMMEVKKKMKTLFSTVTKEVRGHLHSFKKFLKEAEDFENATLSELYDEFKSFMLEEFEDDQEAFEEIVEWFDEQMKDDDSPANQVLKHMQDFKKRMGGKECNWGQMKEKMSRMMGHVGSMMKKKMQYMSTFMGHDAAKVTMVKHAEMMLKHMGVFEEEEMTTGPRTDVCLCV